MSLALSPSSARGDILLQPAYFTSSAFVHPARADVDRLIHEYAQHYTRSAQSRYRPFTLFKQVWHTHDWTWIHFKVLDARSRATFLSVLMRLFTERMCDGETPLNRVAALFGLYTILHTQPSGSAPTLYCGVQVQVTCDVYKEMVMLPDALTGEFLLPVRPHAIYVQSETLRAGILQIISHAEMLPREVVGQDVDTGKKRGRPSRMKKARNSLVALEKLIM